MNLIELDKKIKEHKVIEKFKDGIADGLLHGKRDDKQSHHYYKQGYDYGLTLYNALSKYLEDNNIRVSRNNELEENKL